MARASTLWGLRSEACTNVWREDDALGRVMENVAR